MERVPLAASEAPPRIAAQDARSLRWEWLGVIYARIALGAAFLSAVSSRFGLWDKTLDLKHFAGFTHYTAQVLSFFPSPFILPLAWAATAAETALGILLIVGLWPRPVSLVAAVLLAVFGTSMAVSFGLQSPMDYSVFSASGAALLLSLRAPGHTAQQSVKSL